MFMKRKPGPYRRPVYTNYQYPVDEDLNENQQEPVRCPYMPQHVMHADSLLTHLKRCPATNKHQFTICPYNYAHVIANQLFELHLESCKDYFEKYAEEFPRDQDDTEWEIQADHYSHDGHQSQAGDHSQGWKPAQLPNYPQCVGNSSNNRHWGTPKVQPRPTHRPTHEQEHRRKNPNGAYPPHIIQPDHQTRKNYNRECNKDNIDQVRQQATQMNWQVFGTSSPDQTNWRVSGHSQSRQLLQLTKANIRPALRKRGNVATVKIDMGGSFEDQQHSLVRALDNLNVCQLKQTSSHQEDVLGADLEKEIEEIRARRADHPVYH